MCAWQILKDWNSELQERTAKFRKHAIAIAEWDRRILLKRDVLIRLEVWFHILEHDLCDGARRKGNLVEYMLGSIWPPLTHYSFYSILLLD